jgi:hypothetical protein
MNTLFQPEAKNKIADRLSKLKSEQKAIWGKMSAAQMLAHCAVSMQVPLGEYKPSTGFMTLLGRMMKGTVLNEKPFGKNAPTASAFKIKDDRNFEKEKQNFMNALEKLSRGPSAVVHDKHPILGSLNPEEWGRLHSKHIDHHFRQFGI